MAETRTAGKSLKDITTGGMLSYSCGELGGNILNMLVTGWFFHFYTSKTDNPVPYVSIYLIGIASLIARIVDAVADPFVGYWTDNTKSRLGRRRPFILFGTPVLMAVFLLLFHPVFPRGSTLLAASTMVLFPLFYVCFTIVMVPYLALMPEIATTSRSRIRISTWTSLAMLVANGVSGIAAPKLFGPWGFFNTMCGAVILSSFFLYVMALTSRENPVIEEAENEEDKFTFIQAFALTVKNRVQPPVHSRTAAGKRQEFRQQPLHRRRARHSYFLRPGERPDPQVPESQPV
jgi:glycoside/pentoside/hexuronide:cation symporter, GPH family